ncbi:MAG TPA: putative ABC exporter domain-containing protein, partial [Steroidobacteraceae bacterium]|nr:putative ABC exporter domain-containing protein [Steroidobacteraceae bacterium]
MSAMGALLYLQLTSLQGRIRSRIRRLKQPKYLLGAVVGAAYIYFFFIHRARAGYGNGNGRYGNPGPGRTPNIDFASDLLPTVASLGALALLVVVALSWILPRAQASLAFSEAEIAFLFPAPIRRQTLIHYRLLKSQLGLALTSAILALFTNRWSFLGGNAATHAVGWWVILATLSLHFTGSSFFITRLLNRGVTSWRRRLVVFALVALFLAAAVIWFRNDARAPGAGDLLDARAMAEYLMAMLSSGPLPWLLA